MTDNHKTFPQWHRLAPVILVGLAKRVKYSEGLVGLMIFL